MHYFVIILLGLALGSFLNSWIWRTREGIPILNSRSMCPGCRRQLVWYENIPVLSYLFLQGKCRTCKNSIPKHFIFVEIATALIFVLVTWHSLNSQVFTPEYFFRNIVFSILLIIIFVYDWLYQEILPEVIWVGLAAGLFFNFYLNYSLISMVLGLVVGGGFFLAQFIFSKGKWIGGGDVRMGAMMGVWLGWPLVAVALFFAYIMGAIGGLSLMAVAKKKLNSATPFGTYLALGAFIVLLWGNEIAIWYLKFLR